MTEDTEIHKRQMIIVIYKGEEIIRQFFNGVKSDIGKDLLAVCRFINNKERMENLKNKCDRGEISYLDDTVLTAMGREIKHTFGERSEESTVWNDLMMTSRFSTTYGFSILYSVPFKGTKHIYMRDFKSKDCPKTSEVRHTINLDDLTYTLSTYKSDMNVTLRFEDIQSINPALLAQRLKTAYFTPDRYAYDMEEF